ncbi:endonuclease/exonuclease/phosphatase family protein [uncultured Roseobacter sp.]|uniref:endonuclease/exonuclease/phosphatase family protein n=1 Tax=uncultured Roseobacter sp. TaxID=114847 RepID=UPI00262060D5|nr:endonuclease/exonuclease/phosphatase family protein [uncultured Roseobacter sp.]
MKLLSWNVFNENTDATRIDTCLDYVTPDIVCLQEALPIHLQRLQARFPHMLLGRDYIQRGSLCHLAIASKLPLDSSKVSAHYPENKPHPSLFSQRAGWVEFLDSLSARVQIQDGSWLQIVNLHTSAATGPSTRLTEMEAVAKEHLEVNGRCVVAGDFNMFSRPWLAVFLALPFGFRLSDVATYEKQSVEAWWRDRGFNPATRGITMPKWRLQLDQVFTREIRALNAEIVTNTFGSDHFPLIVELDASE